MPAMRVLFPNRETLFYIIFMVLDHEYIILLDRSMPFSFIAVYFLTNKYRAPYTYIKFDVNAVLLSYHTLNSSDSRFTVL